MRKFVMAASALALMVPGMALAADVPDSEAFQVQLTIQDPPPPPDRVVTITGLDALVNLGTIEKSASFQGNGSAIFDVLNTFCVSVTQGGSILTDIGMTLSQSDYFAPSYSSGLADANFSVSSNGFSIPVYVGYYITTASNIGALGRDIVKQTFPTASSCDPNASNSAFGNSSGLRITAVNSSGGTSGAEIPAGAYVGNFLLTIAPG